MTHNEAAYVSTGAAAGLALATAACVAGDDPQAIAQLPDCTGLKNEVIIHKSHRNGYDHAIRQIGVKLVEIGLAISTYPWELEAAINEKTAAIFWFQGAMTGRGDLPLETVIEIANRHNVPGRRGRRRPSAALSKTSGASRRWARRLAIFSGGKDLRGPQASGLSRRAQGSHRGHARQRQPQPQHWSPHEGGQRRDGRAADCGQALSRRWTTKARASQDEEVVSGWCDALNKLPGVQAERSFPNEAGQPLPRAKVTIDAAKAGLSRDDLVARAPRRVHPSIKVASRPAATASTSTP